MLNLHTKKNFLVAIYSTVILLKLVLLDQISKWWFINFLSQLPDRQTSIFSFLDLIYATNHGISFGLFSNIPTINTIFLILNSVIITYIYILMYKAITLSQIIGLCIIIGGALGNILDRIFRGYVFDFIYFHYGEYGFAVFNFADSFIFIGVSIIIYNNYKNSHLLK